ncbi:hypothetical protein F5141DRAFT_1211118 [Pisolithus sp. B1]|nr:hypothetical protein F5141DRAFT_1211118 [Pisolithus sp. B1]
MMKLSYPLPNDAPSNDAVLALRIARHTPCSACDTCQGLQPPPGVALVLGDHSCHSSSLGDLNQYGSDEDNEPSYLETCVCGHGVPEHGADEAALGREEFSRRGRLATRLDEMLQDVDRLLDFEYADDNMFSLRQQIKLPVSLITMSPTSLDHSSRALSSTPSISAEEPPVKRRRLSPSPLSDADEDEEDDKPLATQVGLGSDVPVRTTQRSGKKMSSMKSKSQTALSATDDVKPDGSSVNGHVSGPKVKVEEKMDESQLTRLATGVTVDTGPSASAAPPTRIEKAAFVELRKGIIQITAVENDGSPRSLIILTGLKTLFRTQLPMMPREYIARLVYDRNSKALAIIKRGYKVVGGICYRPFPHRGFAEIVFFATASVDQVKGYGGMLMDHFKAHVRNTYPNVMHFLTYADNFAVIFFKKQGFSKDITLDRSVWAGYIKDYEGGTIMQCTMLRKVNYLDKANIIAKQRDAVVAKILRKSKSHVTYDGLPQFQEGAPEGVTVDPKDVPGLREGERMDTRHGFILVLNTKKRRAEFHWAFLNPVNGEEVVDYYDVIKRPMDLSTMEHKLNTNQYSNMKTFIDDTQLIFDNCRLYNPEGSVYVKHAAKLERFMKEQVNDYARRLA